MTALVWQSKMSRDEKQNRTEKEGVRWPKGWWRKQISELKRARRKEKHWLERTAPC